MARGYGISPLAVMWEWRMSELHMWADTLRIIEEREMGVGQSVKSPATLDLAAEKKRGLAAAERVRRAFQGGSRTLKAS